jgi:hypothetical protein
VVSQVLRIRPHFGHERLAVRRPPSAAGMPQLSPRTKDGLEPQQVTTYRLEYETIMEEQTARAAPLWETEMRGDAIVSPSRSWRRRAEERYTVLAGVGNDLRDRIHAGRYVTETAEREEQIVVQKRS